MEYYLLLGRMLIAVGLLILNLYALVAERAMVRNSALILSTRPIARASLRMLWWLCFVQTISIIGLTIGTGLRDFYVGETLVEEAPTLVFYIVLAQTLLFYAILGAPAVALLNVMSALRKAHRSQELENARREGWVAKEAECTDCPEHVQRKYHPERFEGKGDHSTERHEQALRYEEDRYTEERRERESGG